MFKHYRRTHLEEFIEELYINHDIIAPDLINIKTITEQLNIWLYFDDVRSKAYEHTTNMWTMFIDNRCTPLVQKIEFLHELCHLLRHTGSQLHLPRLVTRAQENDSEQFVLYAAIPFFMLSKLDFPPTRKEIIKHISDVFWVPYELAEKRYDQILRRELEGKLLESTARYNDSFKGVIKESNDETKVYAYYDPSGEFEGPSQLVLAVDSQILYSGQEVSIALNDRSSFLEIDNPHELGGMPVYPSDIRCSNGTIKLLLSNIIMRHGYSYNKFVIQMNDVNSLLDFENRF
ncbi:ImmA/IrrE family metallo-endopeptidase [Paenibacillus sp. FSL K6-2524]|uniref:ImmA/IrrE family metallo-endopeptidase n=1 Tax=Paenibacillus sp. FSL K6-2524 TaxID=2954516 RepID=UPI0030FBD3C0